MKKCIILGISGGIAAYKAAELASMLVKAGFDIRVIMTENATKFVAPLTFSTLTGNEVVWDMFAQPQRWEIEHITLAKRADAVVIAPATANIIGKLANGIADDSLTTTVMATHAKVLIAPAMNTAMYNNPVVQKNLSMLQALGYGIIEPASGRLACGDVGIGKLADVTDIYDAVVSAVEQKKDFAGKTVLVTAGPTREAIDPVRYITNRSSGLMGYSIAEEAHARGARVILISGPVNLPAPAGVEKIDVVSTGQMHAAVMDKLGEADIIVKAAAPADYTAAHKSGQKIKRNGSLALELVENADIAADVGRNKGSKILVAFAAESENLRENALKKLKEKNADIIVANDILRSDAGFESPANAAVVFGRDGYVEELPLMSKREMARRILDLVKNYE